MRNGTFVGWVGLALPVVAGLGAVVVTLETIAAMVSRAVGVV